MATKQTPASHSEPYPTLRGMALVYKSLGVLVAGLSIVVGVMMMVDGTGSAISGGIGLIFTGLVTSTTLWLIAEGIEVALDIEYNTRQTMEQVSTASQRPGASSVDAATLTKILEKLVASQAQTNQRLDELATIASALKSELGTEVKILESVAESSKVAATVLYKQSTRSN